MSIRSGQSIIVDFTTRALGSSAVNADSLPTGTLVVNGADNAATVTITNVAAGIYKASVTLPTLVIGDIVSLRIAATVSGISDNAIIWTDTKDVAIDASGYLTLTQAFPANFASLAISSEGIITMPAIPANWITSEGIAVGALNGKGDWLLAASYSPSPSAGVIAQTVWNDDGVYLPGTKGSQLASLNSLTTGTLIHIGNVNPITGTLQIVRGSDYYATDGTGVGPIKFPVGGGVPDLTGLIVMVYFALPDKQVVVSQLSNIAAISVQATVISPGTPLQGLAFDLPSAQTVLLVASSYVAIYVVIFGNGHKSVIAEQQCRVTNPAARFLGPSE